MTEQKPTYETKVEPTAVPDSGVPTWAKDLVVYWRDKLLLTSWTVEIFSSSHPHGDENVLGTAVLYPEILTAHITLRDDIPQEQTAEWERVIIHEMVHVRLAEVTELVIYDFIPELGASAVRIAEAAFRRAVEPTVESLAHVLWGLNTVPTAHAEETAVAVIEAFVRRVCDQAEQNMEKTGRLEGAHYAAMTSELELMRANGRS